MNMNIRGQIIMHRERRKFTGGGGLPVVVRARDRRYGDRGDPFASALPFDDTLSSSRRVETLVHQLENFLQKCVEPSRHRFSLNYTLLPSTLLLPLDRSLRPSRYERNEARANRYVVSHAYEDHVDRNEAGGRAGRRVECHNFGGGRVVTGALAMI